MSGCTTSRPPASCQSRARSGRRAGCGPRSDAAEAVVVPVGRQEVAGGVDRGAARLEKLCGSSRPSAKPSSPLPAQAH